MADFMSKEHVARVLRIAEDRIDQRVKQYVAAAEGIPYGHKQAKDEDVQAIWDQMLAMYPPQQMILPTGESVFASPWVMAVRKAENGAEFLNRYKAKVRKEIERGDTD